MLRKVMKKFISKYFYIFFPIIITALCCVLGITRYIVYDDVTMLLMAESFKTNIHSEQLMFISVIMGYVLKFLYSVIPGISWFGVAELSTLTLSFILILKVAKKYHYDVVFVSIISIIQIYIIVNLTFTSVAFVCATASILLPIAYVDNLNKSTVKYLVISFVGCFLAFLMRNGQVLYVVLLLTIPLLVFHIIENRNKRNAMITVSAILIIAVVSSVIIKEVNHIYNASIPAELYFNQFQAYRSAANDAEIFNYHSHADYFQNLGISEDNYLMFTSWFMGDKSIFSADFAKAVAQSRDFSENYNLNVLSIISNIIGSKKLLAFIFALFIVYITDFILISKTSERIKATSVFLISVAAVVFLFFRRRGLFRVCSAIILCAIILLLYIYISNKTVFIENKKFHFHGNKGMQIVISVGCLLLIILSFVYSIYRDNRLEYNAKEENEVVDFISKENNYIYLTDIWTLQDYSTEIHSENFFKANTNVPYYIVDTNYDIYSYYWYDNLNNLGLSDYSDAVLFAILDDRVQTVLSNTNPEMFVNYFAENYNKKVTYSLVKDFESGIYIYDFDLVE